VCVCVWLCVVSLWGVGCGVQEVTKLTEAVSRMQSQASNTLNTTLSSGVRLVPGGGGGIGRGRGSGAGCEIAEGVEEVRRAMMGYDAGSAATWHSLRYQLGWEPHRHRHTHSHSHSHTHSVHTAKPAVVHRAPERWLRCGSGGGAEGGRGRKGGELSRRLTLSPEPEPELQLSVRYAHRRTVLAPHSV
jgi:hypothetical protein